MSTCMQGSSSVAINEHLRLKGGARRRVELIKVDSTLVREVIEDVESLDGGRAALLVPDDGGNQTSSEVIEDVEPRRAPRRAACTQR